MEFFLNSLIGLNDMLHAFVWGTPMLVLLVGTGVWCSVRTGFFQLRHIRLWLGNTLFACLRSEKVRKTNDRASISQYQSLCTALAATVGTGNIAGVATAIASGGPGAVFWMWVSAFFGMMTIYAENVLGILYRYKNKKGDWIGGAMVYIERGLKCKWLAVIFSCFCVLASFGIGNMSQGNSISVSMQSAFGVPPIVTGLLVAGSIGLVMVGGIKRIAQVTEKIVPFMACFYVIGALTVILCNAGRLPDAFSAILKEAFNLRAGVGGVAGYGVMAAMRMGVARGVFSNEAGLGSSVMIHAASDVKEPCVQGMWGIFEVCIDTLVICTLTALTILTSGVYDQSVYQNALHTSAFSALPLGAALTGKAFSSLFGVFGSSFVAAALTLFAFSTLLGWSYYGERGVEYLFGLKAIPVYRVLFVLIIVVGCVSGLQAVWQVSDTFNGLMALPNLIAVLLLSNQVFRQTKLYMKKQKI